MGADQAGEQDLRLLIITGFLNVTHRFINSYFLQLFQAFLVTLIRSQFFLVKAEKGMAVAGFTSSSVIW